MQTEFTTDVKLNDKQYVALMRLYNYGLAQAAVPVRTLRWLQSKGLAIENPLEREHFPVTDLGCEVLEQIHEVSRERARKMTTMLARIYHEAQAKGIDFRFSAVRCDPWTRKYYATTAAFNPWGPGGKRELAFTSQTEAVYPASAEALYLGDTVYQAKAALITLMTQVRSAR
jgi:hypothetical protein